MTHAYLPSRTVFRIWIPKFTLLDSKLDQVLACCKLTQEVRRLRLHLAFLTLHHTRPPAPLFNGSKEGTKITTWFEQFASYATILRLTPRLSGGSRLSLLTREGGRAMGSDPQVIMLESELSGEARGVVGFLDSQGKHVEH